MRVTVSGRRPARDVSPFHFLCKRVDSPTGRQVHILVQKWNSPQGGQVHTDAVEDIK